MGVALPIFLEYNIKSNKGKNINNNENINKN